MSIAFCKKLPAPGDLFPRRVFVCTYEPIGGDSENPRQGEELVVGHKAGAALNSAYRVLFDDRALYLHFCREGRLRQAGTEAEFPDAVS